MSGRQPFTREQDAAWQARVARARQALLDDLMTVIRDICGPNGKKAGNTWSTFSPLRAGDNAQAFGIYVAGAKKGGWKDFVTGETGDVFKLVQAKYSHASFTDTVKWVEDRYGLKALTPEARDQLNQQRERQAARAASDEDAERQRKMRAACHRFSQAEPEIEGTPVEAYWQARGVALDQLPYRDRRWLRYRLDADMSDPRKQVWPCQYAGFTDAGGTMRALHVTYLARDGAGKAPVLKQKLMFGPMKGCVIRINHGVGGLDPEAAAVAGVTGPVVICEGIEDAVTLAAMTPELRVWAAGSLGNYAAVFDHPCVSSFIVARDNDWGNAQAAAAFEAALARFRSFGKPVSVVRAPGGAKDFNDLVKEGLHEEETQ